MTLLSLLAAAFRGVHRRAVRYTTYQDLRDLDPRLLKDIGLRLENGHVYSVGGIQELPTAEETVHQESRGGERVFVVEPEGTGG